MIVDSQGHFEGQIWRGIYTHRQQNVPLLTLSRDKEIDKDHAECHQRVVEQPVLSVFYQFATKNTFSTMYFLVLWLLTPFVPQLTSSMLQKLYITRMWE